MHNLHINPSSLNKYSQNKTWKKKSNINEYEKYVFRYKPPAASPSRAANSSEKIFTFELRHIANSFSLLFICNHFSFLKNNTQDVVVVVAGFTKNWKKNQPTQHILYIQISIIVPRPHRTHYVLSKSPYVYIYCSSAHDCAWINTKLRRRGGGAALLNPPNPTLHIYAWNTDLHIYLRAAAPAYNFYKRGRTRCFLSNKRNKNVQCAYLNLNLAFATATRKSHVYLKLTSSQQKSKKINNFQFSQLLLVPNLYTIYTRSWNIICLASYKLTSCAKLLFFY